MKKSILILMTAALCCLSFSQAHAQRYYDDRARSYDYYPRTGTVASYLDLHIGDGIGRGAKGFGGASISFLYRFSQEFQFGVGSGVDYIHALALQGKLDKNNEYDYHGEFTLPVFMRGRYYLGTAGYSYDQANFFAQCDIGYRFGISAYNSGKNKGITGLAKNFERCNAKGFFVEPQLGIAPNQTLSFSLGFPFQNYTRNVTSASVSDLDGRKEYKSKDRMYMGIQMRMMISF